MSPTRPAGSSSVDAAGEGALAGARRELEEETGFTAAAWHRLGTCVSSGGLTDEAVVFFAATGLERVGPGGGVGNVKDVSKGEAELGWSYAHTSYNGYNGKGKFDAAQPNVRHFATLYPAALQTAVPKDSSIQSFADMKDKSLSPGKKTYSGFAAAELVFAQYGLTAKRLKKAKPDAIVMHPGPANRGIEIESSVMDGDQSVILNQVTYGIAVRMAVMSMIAAQSDTDS